MIMCYVMSPEQMIMAYGPVWISAHVGMCTLLNLCVQPCMNTHVPCMPPCMIAFKRAFAALREEQIRLHQWELSMRGCVHP